MKIGIDASNIRLGGGVTHLKEVLNAVEPGDHGIEEIIVWGGRRTLDVLPVRDFIRYVHQPALDRSLIHRTIWHQTAFTGQVKKHCDILFVPGGNYTGSFRPFVTMARNLLPFDVPERNRYNLFPYRLRFAILEKSQIQTFRRASGIIFMTENTRRIVESRMGSLRARYAIIPHGISPQFFHPPRNGLDYNAYSPDKPFRLLYISSVTYYKHQWHVVEAVSQLRKEGYPVTLDLVGKTTTNYGHHKLHTSLRNHDPAGEFITYLGEIPYNHLPGYYNNADGFVFASTCETFGQIVLEAMAAGLPIACSNRSSMNEVLGDTGLYFNPEKPVEIASALRKLIESIDVRKHFANAAYRRASTFSWEKCARKTFSFITSCSRRS